MEPSLPPPHAADLPTGASERRHACSANHVYGGGSEDDVDDFEFTPLLPQRRRRTVGPAADDQCRPRTAVVHAAVLAHAPPAPQQRAPRRRLAVAAKSGSTAAAVTARRVRWHEMAFGSVRVPAAMDMGEIRRRLQARRRRLADGEGDAAAAAAGWAPWRLIRSLSCKGVEAVAVAAAAAPVRLM